MGSLEIPSSFLFGVKEEEGVSKEAGFVRGFKIMEARPNTLDAVELVVVLLI